MRTKIGHTITYYTMTITTIFFLDLKSLHSTNHLPAQPFWSSLPKFHLNHFIFLFILIPGLLAFVMILPILCDLPPVCQYFCALSAWSYQLPPVSCKTLSMSNDKLSAVPITEPAHQWVFTSVKAAQSCRLGC